MKGNGDIVEQYVTLLHRHSRPVIVVLLLCTALMGYGLTMADEGFVIAGFDPDSPEADANEFIETHFGSEDDKVVTVVVLRDESGDDTALSRSALIESLELQSAINDVETIENTLVDEHPITSLATVVTDVALREEGSDPANASIDDRIAILEDLDDEAVTDLTAMVIEDDEDALRQLLPLEFESVDRGAEAQLAIVTHDRGVQGEEDLPPELVEAQVAIADLAESTDGSYDTFAFGPGIVDERSTQATGESFALLGPIALVLVLLLLIVAYRDVFDILLSLLGIVMVLIWMGGFIGWLDIQFTQILIAVPFLLIGLSIDYGLHVVMRYREERAKAGSSVSGATILGLTGVIIAIGATTVTTSIGFFSNLTSDIGSIADFGLLSGLGIIGAFVIFGAFLPALKFEVEALLESRGFTRSKRAFGTGGITASILGIGAQAAKRAPALVLAFVLLLSLAGGYGAVNVDTSIDQRDFLPDDRPGWMEYVPEPFQPGQYAIKEHAAYLDRTFAGASMDSQVDILIEGDITEPSAFNAIEDAGEHVGTQPVTVTFASGDAAVQTPLDQITLIAQDNETVASALNDADSTGDDRPDQELTALLDAAYAADSSAMGEFVLRTDGGEYEAARIDVTTRGDARGGDVLDQMRASASIADDHPALSAIATGPLILLEVSQDDVLSTLITTFSLTMVLVGIFLCLLFGRQHRSYSLGLITMIPVVAALSWILGLMYLLDIPYNSETAIITAIAIGIGVDFAIHISERFVQERDLTDDATTALNRTVEGTGGALLACAMTTVVGFGILALTLIPSLQRFGIVTGVTIAFAWVSSVLVLPSLLVLWDRYLATDAVRGTSTTVEQETRY